MLVGNYSTVPQTRISCITVFSKSQNVRWGPSVILYGQEFKALTYSFRGPQKQVNKDVVPAMNYMTITKLSKLGRMPSFLGIL